jgi:putative transcriptional regulator
MDGFGGHLLIAPAWMVDGNFARTLVLLLQHESQGAFGLVLNRATGSTVREVWTKAAEGDCNVDGPILLGGPVPGPVFALHDREEDGERTPIEGVYLSADPEQLARLMASPPARLKVFAGYAGWGGSQLEHELQDAAWMTAPATLEDAFCDPSEAAWEDALRRATGAARAPWDPPPRPPGVRPDAN